MDIIGNNSLRQTWDDLAHLYKHKTALLFEDTCGMACRYSYAEMNAAINRTANLFTALGVGKGHKVAVQLRNCPEFLFCLFGLAKIGAVIVPLNAHFLHEECAYILEKCDIDIVVTQAEFLPIYEQVERNGTLLRHLLLARNKDHAPPQGVLNFNALLHEASPELGTAATAQHVDGDTIAEILFTSGTTSRPKGVVITHYNLCFAGYYTAWQGAMRSDDIYLTPMPAFHIDCQCTAMMPTFTSGATLVLLEKYSARRFWSQVCRYRATLTECIPLIVRTLLMQPQAPWEQQHCLRDIFFYLNISDVEKDTFLERFNITFLSSYGMTETIVGLIGDRPGDKRRWPSLGRAGLTYEAKIADENGRELPPGHVGEIWVKGVPGKTLFKEYYQNAEATARALSADGWLRTGDSGTMDEEGFFFFVDRNVNMIKRCGENISCVEIENALVCHEDIVEAAVIGVPDTICDETVKAFVVVRHGKTLSPAAITDFLCARLASFKVPSVIELCTTLPRTATGKVQKHVLRERQVVPPDGKPSQPTL